VVALLSMWTQILGAVVNLNTEGHYLHWNNSWFSFYISYANLIVIILMIVVFILALVLPFPHSKDRDR